MSLVVIGGLPGAGKTTLATAVAAAIDASIFTKDVIEASLWRSGIGTDEGSWQAAEDLLTTLAGEELRRGRSAVLDTVARLRTSRDAWRALARECSTGFSLIECTCSDETVHEARLDGRVRGIPGWYEVEWSDVVRGKQRWEPWVDDRLVLDAVDPPERNLELALTYVRAR